MKVCCIGDIHGTNKFLDCYEQILKEDNDCEKIIVFGDHFDPYEHFTIDEMIEKYNKFSEISQKDERIISLLGNHDLSYYVISSDKTNRTHRWKGASRITDCIMSNLDKSYMCYRIGDWLFSHAGVSQKWLDFYTRYYSDFSKKILNNHLGWTKNELYTMFKYFENDMSGYGNDPYQGCTWIRPTSLVTCGIEGYNQVVAHTRVDENTKITMDNGKDLWLIDTCGKSNYFTLNIESEGE